MHENATSLNPAFTLYLDWSKSFFFCTNDNVNERLVTGLKEKDQTTRISLPNGRELPTTTVDIERKSTYNIELSCISVTL